MYNQSGREELIYDKWRQYGVIGFFISLIPGIIALKWILKRKQGEPFSKKSIWTMLGFGAAGMVLLLAILFAIAYAGFDIAENTVSGALVSSFILAAIPEEIIKLCSFKLMRNNIRELVTWHDAVIAYAIVGLGFVFAENLGFGFTTSIIAAVLRSIIPGHMMFGIISGYFWGRGQVTGNKANYVLMMLLPMLIHGVYGFIVVGMLGIATASANAGQDTFTMVLVAIAVAEICMAALFFVMMSKVSKWGKSGSMNTPV